MVKLFTPKTKLACKLKLLNAFPGSFFNKQDEFILHKFSNTYFNFGICESKLEVNCKILEWCSRDASKGIPYHYPKRNLKFQQRLQQQINHYLGTNFTADDFETIYDNFGNSINRKKTIAFIQSGYKFLNERNIDNEQRN